jgi:8-oxo-dGTP pyrophosphatase MutT (NUDIX family)|tara:strand:+ start:112 stop:1962 length:1851 start_codon:yes stop_codon:yes gene_type:complete
MVTEQDLIESKDEIEELEELAEQKEPVVNRLRDVGIEIKASVNDYIMSDYEAVNLLSKNLNINASDARKQLSSFPTEYSIDGENIPDLVKKMRKARRQLKGEQRERMAKAIDTIIDGYSDHINKCIDSIYWIKPYKPAILKMGFSEKDLMKINKIDSVNGRRNIIDAICKYWESDLKKEGMVYSKEYAQLEKECRLAKRDYKQQIKSITDQSITKSKKERIMSFIESEIIKSPSIGAKQIHDRMPNTLHKSTTTNMISKMVKKLDVASVDGAYYKLPTMLKKNIWAYTAAFIDSDGYITMDRNHNPRVGLIATGERGRAFMEEMHKSIGFGKLHLNQKSPQQTRPVQRLNFYSQNDVYNLLEKCLPHFKLKKGNAKLLMELIRMKKSYKKEDWYKGRCDEIFKLMKWENHKDHVGFDWLKEGIYLDNIQKYKDNCKMSLMDSMENIGGVIIKANEMEDKGLSWYAKGNNKKKFLLDKDGVRHAAGAAVFKGDKVLIVERSPEEDTMIGMWEFAGGKVEEPDEFNADGTPDAEKVCMIEAGEELGLKKKPSSKLGVHFDRNMKPPKKYHCFRIDVDDDWNPTLSFEHSDYKWITIDELKEYPDDKLSHHVAYLIDKM